MAVKRALAIGILILALAGCGSTAATSHETTASPKPSATPSPSPTLSMTEVASMVRTLYYNESQAYQSSLKQGDAMVLADDYPGSVDKGKYLACSAQFEVKYAGETISEVPEIDTLAPDPNWVGPPRYKDEADWIFAGKKPNGTTFILTLDSTYTRSGQQQTSKDQVHVTIWNGKAYDYQTSCPVR